MNSSLALALDRIAERAADVRRAYIPGAVPRYDDVVTSAPSSKFTPDPLSVAAPEDAYFVSADDSGRQVYTRDGSFAVHQGRLVDSNGRPILGSSAGASLNELRVDPVDDALGRIGDAAVEPDGTFVYRRDTVDPRSGKRDSLRVVVGRIALARFPAGTRLNAGDGSHAVPPEGVVPEIGLAADGKFAALAPMQRERSRVDLDESLIRLKEAYLAFDALRAAEAAKHHLGKMAMDLLK